MSRKHFTVYFMVFTLVILSFSLSFAGKYTEHRATRVSPADIDQWEQTLDLNAVSGSSPIEMAPTELGRTWYDYATNNTMGRMLAYSTNGIHFTFMKRQPSAAGNRYVTYDWWDLTLGIFYSNLSVTEAQQTGWGRVVNGVNDEALTSFHGGGTWLYQDVSEAGYNFSQVFHVPGAPSGAVFPGIARIDDNVVFMSQLQNVAGSSWQGGNDTVIVSTDYMQTWAGRELFTEDPFFNDYGTAELWPSFNPTNPTEFSVLYYPNNSTVNPNSEQGFVKMATTTDLGATWTTSLIWEDDSVFQDGSNVSQYIIENFGQGNGMYTDDGVYHAVYGAVQGVIDTSSTAINMWPILYWNTRDRQMVELTSDFYSRPTDPATQTAMGTNRPGNGLGNAYPHIAEGPNTGELLVVWQQWEDNGSGGTILLPVTGGAGLPIFATDIWGAYSSDGGVTWTDPFFVAGNSAQSDIYPNIPRNFLWNATSDSIYIDLLWMYDIMPGTSVFTTPNSDPSEVIWNYERIAIPQVPNSIGGNDNVVNGFRLAQNYPNPFNPSTTITFDLKYATKVSLEVFNILGQRVATVANGKLTAGPHEVTFDASNLASGVYVYRLVTDEVTLTKKMMLMK